MTYRPPHVRADERAPLLALISTHPLATLITVGLGIPVVTYVPMLAREEGDALYLEGHIARANDQWTYGDSHGAALFRIAEHYVSPTWYATKLEHGKVVPTFDYIAVEARGLIRFIEDRDWKRAFVARLTIVEEAKVNAGWTIEEAPDEYLESQLKAIVGVQMRVDDLTGLFKLNRHHPEANVAGVIEGLEKQGTPDALAIAAYMRGDLASRQS
jgi:transcriptional regulator